MNEDTKYNGWTNYATWRIQLEIISDYVDAEMERIHEGDTELLDMSVSALADNLKDYVEELIHNDVAMIADNGYSLAEGYALAFLDDVNWRELAEHAQEDWQTELKLQESK